jgi:DNA replication protein DnaC
MAQCSRGVQAGFAWQVNHASKKSEVVIRKYEERPLYSVLFATAIDVINTLAAAQSTGRMKTELKKYTRPSVLILDELGFLPIDKAGADLLFQVISQRYEQAALVITSNRAFKNWPEIFNNDSTLTSAILDRLLHHPETVLIEGKSFRMKDTIET